jgi:hypothetical protein
MSTIGRDVRDLKFLQTLKNDFAEIVKGWDDLQARKLLGWAKGCVHGAFGIAVVLNYSTGGYPGRILLAWYQAYLVSLRDDATSVRVRTRSRFIART